MLRVNVVSGLNWEARKMRMLLVENTVAAAVAAAAAGGVTAVVVILIVFVVVVVDVENSSQTLAGAGLADFDEVGEVVTVGVAEVAVEHENAELFACAEIEVAVVECGEI